MTDLEKYIEHLEEYYENLRKRRKPSCDEEDEIKRKIINFENKKIKYKMENLKDKIDCAKRFRDTGNISKRFRDNGPLHQDWDMTIIRKGDKEGLKKALEESKQFDEKYGSKN